MGLQNPKTILVIQIGKIGDMILTTPLFSELKKLFPYTILKVLASEINKDIPVNSKSVDEVIIYKKNIFKDILLFNKLFRNIEVWIDTKDNYSKTGQILCKIFKPEFSLGFTFTGKDKLFTGSLNDFVYGNHAVNINLSPVNYFRKSMNKELVMPSFNIPAEIQNKYKNIIADNSNKIILINISAGMESRYLQKEKWIELINKINKNSSYNFYIIGMKKDIEDINYILKETKNENSRYIQTLNILETAEVIRRSDIIITPDTSVVHICSAFNKPVTAIYPDVKWNLNKFKPLSKINEVVISKDKNSVGDVSAENIYAAFVKLEKKLLGGNAESRTRVRKEDH